MTKNKVVYLFGAGATQGEIKRVDDDILLLNKDITQEIIFKIEKEKISILNEVKNELNDDANVEHLISLYESIGTKKYFKISHKLKELYRQAILNKLRLLEKNHPSFQPVLISSLLDMHDIKGINEELISIITLNYDDITEMAMNYVKNGFNYYINVKNKQAQYNIGSKYILPIIKLHGSFNWKRDYPLIVVDKYSLKKGEDVLWIPPGVEKRKDIYPFNILWEKAKDMLNCNVLRIIGCSLNRNDWQLIALIFAMQKINNPKKFKIEIIDYNETGEEIKTNYPYLKVETITEISECKEYAFDYFGYKVKSSIPKSVIDYLSRSNTKLNIFEWWLRAKGNQLNKKLPSLITGTNIFENFIKQKI